MVAGCQHPRLERLGYFQAPVPPLAHSAPGFGRSAHNLPCPVAGMDLAGDVNGFSPSDPGLAVWEVV